MDNQQSCSVYELITKLCERTLISSGKKPIKKHVKKLRAKSYEILLSKSIPTYIEDNILENNKDPICNLLAWQYLLTNTYNLPDCANKIQKCVETLEKSGAVKNDVVRDVLYVLIQLRTPPEIEKGISSHSITSGDSCIKFRVFTEDSFYLDLPTICCNAKYTNASFYMKPFQKNLNSVKSNPSSVKSTCKTCLRVPSGTSCALSTSINHLTSSKDIKEGSEINIALTKEDVVSDIWELVSKTVFTEHRTWETLGNSCPEKEKPFLTESSSETCTVLNEFIRAERGMFLIDFKVKPNKIIDRKTFIKHIKFLLVGMSSDSFKINPNNEMYLVENITVEDISRDSLEKYSECMIFCGSCYRALNGFCHITEYLSSESKAFVFKEFSKSVQRYLSYYRVATLSVLDNTGLLNIHDHIKPLYDQLRCLSSICKVEVFAKSAQLPNGVDLLNELYERLIDLPWKGIEMILYSIFFPCVEVYFGRFLKQWIFDGVLNDPYNEFFVYNSRKFMKPKSRSYWTKSYVIQECKIPDFLTDLAKDILYCGKAMNLLRLCAPSNPLCTNLLEQKASLLSCRLNSEQIADLQQEVTCYNLECMVNCGSSFSIQEFLSKIQEDALIIANLAVKKRAATIKRLEVEKLKEATKIFEEKQKIVANLRADYDKALQDKKTAIINDMLKELKHNEYILKVHSLRKEIIKEEALKLIDYYDNLMEESERKRLNIEKHIQRLKTTDITKPDELKPVELKPDELKPVELKPDELKPDELKPNELKPNELKPNELKPQESLSKYYSSIEFEKDLQKIPDEIEIITFESTSESSFHSAISENIPIKEEEMFPLLKSNTDEVLKSNKEEVLKSVCLDTLNANSNTNSSSNELSDNNLNSQSDNNNGNEIYKNDLLKIVLENKEAALKNKRKVMSYEMDVWRDELNNDCGDERKIEGKKFNSTLSQLEKNRLKVMSSEFGLSLKIKGFISEENLNLKNKKEEIYIKKLDNENYLNKNIIENDSINEDTSNNNINSNSISKKQLTLDLNLKIQSDFPSTTSIFSRFWKSPNFELTKPTPMSVDSTPCTAASCSKSISTGLASTIDEFSFPKDTSSNTNINPPKNPTFINIDDINILTKTLQQSVSIPLKIQTELINNELLRHFFVNLRYLDHLNGLRNYFFLLDGEFSRKITEDLFNKLYTVDCTTDLINVNTLQGLIRNALDSSIKLQKDFGGLSFKINNFPNGFDLDNPDVLSCLSLTYEVHWPLNILLPGDIILKYDEVFKFLLKLNRVSWVLKKIFQELKLFSKRCGTREEFFILSPDFKRIQFYRHIMTHFLQTLQNYVIGEVLQPSWDTFEKNLPSASNLDDLYNLHNSYVKDILFKCLLNKRFTAIQKVIQNTLAVILKFHRYLSSGTWTFDEDDGTYNHSNFKKLETIFSNFQEFVVYVFKAGRKIAKVGYQPHLLQLLDMLDVNEYYSKNIIETVSSIN